MNFVLDTNVIISALYREPSIPYDVYLIALSRGNYLYYTESIYLEYLKILHRKKFGFTNEIIEKFLSLLTKKGVLVKNIDYHYEKRLIDESDRKFYELAKSYECYLITGNKKHYPNDPIVMSPSEFMNKLQMSA